MRGKCHLEENIQLPLAPFFYTISTMHCMTVSLAGGGAGLGTMWGQQLATSMLADAGFTDVEVREVENDTFTATTSRSSDDADATRDTWLKAGSTLAMDSSPA
jgi:hypothetical protein